MSNVAEKRAAESVGQSEPQGAVSVRAPFEAIAKVADLSVPLRRPKKCGPSSIDEAALRQELEAWDAASDEALQSFEDSLEE